MSLLYWVLWGFLGAFVYAAPRLLVSTGEARQGAKPVGPAVSEFFVALTFGPIFAAGFGEFGAEHLGLVEPRALRAVSLVIGMVANPVAPLLIDLATGQIMARLGLAKKGDQSG